MGLAPLLLLPLLVSVLDAAPGDCDNENFGVDQPEHLAAPKGSSIRIPCSFHHSWELAENPEVKIGWRWKHFHGDFIYNQTLNWTPEEFKDRLHWDWIQGQTRGALLIRNLRREDATSYFCRVTLNTKRCGPWVIQSIWGTKLRVIPAAPENCDTSYLVSQPQYLSASEGGSVRIPCSFHHSWELAENPRVRVDWRWKQYHGHYVYIQIPNLTHKEFKDRFHLDWTQGQTQGALLIWDLRRGDATRYFCQVTLNTKRCGTRTIQSIRGTKLSVIPAQPETDLNVTNSTEISGPLRLDTVVTVTMTVALLKMIILGLISYLVWKRSQEGGVRVSREHSERTLRE